MDQKPQTLYSKGLRHPALPPPATEVVSRLPVLTVIPVFDPRLAWPREIGSLPELLEILPGRLPQNLALWRDLPVASESAGRDVGR